MARGRHLRGRRGGVRLVLSALGFAAVVAAIGPGGPATAQQSALTVSLVRQDFSDCTNSDVNDDNKIKTSGIIALVRDPDGTTTVKVAMTVAPDTTYHFYLKCVRQLGDIKTDDEGVGSAVFGFATNSTGNTYAFDMYPEGAPAGNKFQSVQVRFQ